MKETLKNRLPVVESCFGKSPAAYLPPDLAAVKIPTYLPPAPGFRGFEAKIWFTTFSGNTFSSYGCVVEIT
jgi:hypothetical protein